MTYTSVQIRFSVPEQTPHEFDPLPIFTFGIAAYMLQALIHMHGVWLPSQSYNQSFEQWTTMHKHFGLSPPTHIGAIRV